MNPNHWQHDLRKRLKQTPGKNDIVSMAQWYAIYSNTNSTDAARDVQSMAEELLIASAVMRDET
jgi:hypothetical protein